MGNNILGLILLQLALSKHVILAQVILSGDGGNIPPNPHKSNTPTSGTIKMGTPDLNDEDQMSLHMPSYLKCDACRIIAMRYTSALESEISKYQSIKRREKEVSENRIQEILEGVCDESWEQHGIKEVDGVKRLSGPGYETSEVPGVMQGGGKWPFRFKEMCSEMLGDIGDDVIYNKYRGGDAKAVEKLICYKANEHVKTPFCKTKSKSKKDKAKKKNRNEL